MFRVAPGTIFADRIARRPHSSGGHDLVLAFDVARDLLELVVGLCNPPDPYESAGAHSSRSAWRHLESGRGCSGFRRLSFPVRRLALVVFPFRRSFKLRAMLPLCSRLPTPSPCFCVSMRNKGDSGDGFRKYEI